MFNRNPEKRVKYKFVILQVVSMDKSELKQDPSCFMKGSISVESMHLTGRILFGLECCEIIDVFAELLREKSQSNCLRFAKVRIEIDIFRSR